MDLNTSLQVPKEFIRGQTLEFIMELPPEIPYNWFNNGTNISTSLQSKLRRVENAGADGFIADLAPMWWDVSTGKYIKIKFMVDFMSTFNWPLGPAVFDVVFTLVKTGSGSYTKMYRSLPIKINIVDGVT
jgi:hypothetical protein